MKTNTILGIVCIFIVFATLFIQKPFSIFSSPEKGSELIENKSTTLSKIKISPNYKKQWNEEHQKLKAAIATFKEKNATISLSLLEDSFKKREEEFSFKEPEKKISLSLRATKFSFPQVGFAEKYPALFQEMRHTFVLLQCALELTSLTGKQKNYLQFLQQQFKETRLNIMKKEEDNQEKKYESIKELIKYATQQIKDTLSITQRKEIALSLKEKRKTAPLNLWKE